MKKNIPTATKDVLGNDVTVDDWVAMAISSGYGSTLFIGKVVGFTPARMLVVETDKQSVHDERNARLAGLGRQVVYTATAYDFSIKKFIKIEKPVDYHDPE
jgi:hypothetical protein